MSVSISSDQLTSQWMAQAILHHQQGDLPHAEAFYRRVLEREPDHADALHFLGMLAAQAGHPQAGLRLIERSIALAPESAHFHVNRGNVLHSLGFAEQAIAAYRTALAGAAEDVSAQINLAQALRGLGRLDEALDAAAAAVQLRADDAELHNLHGAILGDLGRLEGAIEAFERSLALRPEDVGVRENLERARRELAARLSSTEAEAEAPTAAAAEAPAPVPATDPTEAVLRFEVDPAPTISAPLSPDPGDARTLAAADSQALVRMLHEGRDPGEMFEAHGNWNASHAAALTRDATPHFVDMDPHRRLRVGFVVTDAGNGMIGRSLLSWLAARERGGFEAICYASDALHSGSGTAAQLRAQADGFSDVASMSDAALASAIRADRIDILIDLAGHTAGNRLLTFARKPAPVQATWLGYPHTTGLTAMDDRLTDSIIDPPGHPLEALNVETLARLDGCFLCAGRTTSDELPPIGRIRRRRVTLGSFSAVASVSPAAMESWGQILRAVPGARLLWANRELREPQTIAHVRASLRRQGVEVDRVELLGQEDDAGRLGLFEKVDIVLDTHPCSDPGVVCAAVAMGVPVVTLAARNSPGRGGASVLTAAGLINGVARDSADYVLRASALARRGVRSAEDRRALRDAVARSRLCDSARFASAIEAAFREMWKRFCGA